jgi:peptidoglycan/LPS O-acetylase OafA/YrhL
MLPHERKTHTPLSTPKKHYIALDGLRGIAAMAVVVFHFMEIIISDFTKNPIAHGYLAVDFFFCLSGFVVAHAYDDKIGHMGMSAFLKRRLQRLHPLVVLGSVLGLLAFLYDPFSDSSSRYSILQITILFFLSATLVPYPAMEDRYFNLFGLNAPSWSLFWEYVANLLYAVILVRLGRKWLLGMAVVAAVLLVYIAKDSGSLIGGWNGETFWHGGARMFYSFLAGVCVLRYQLIFKRKLGFVSLSILLLLAFFTPYHPSSNWYSEPALIVLFFPFLIAIGAGTKLSSQQEKFCRLAGSLSYPLYITHYCIMWMFGSYYSQTKPSPDTLIPLVFGLIAFQLLVAYLASRYFDGTWKSTKRA